MNRCIPRLLKPPKLQDSIEAAPRVESDSTKISGRFHTSWPPKGHCCSNTAELRRLKASIDIRSPIGSAMIDKRAGSLLIIAGHVGVRDYLPNDSGRRCGQGI